MEYKYKKDGIGLQGEERRKFEKKSGKGVNQNDTKTPRGAMMRGQDKFSGKSDGQMWGSLGLTAQQHLLAEKAQTVEKAGDGNGCWRSQLLLLLVQAVLGDLRMGKERQADQLHLPTKARCSPASAQQTDVWHADERIGFS
ncbi:uncharacterized protein SPSK_04594 [Sporothrix schenckii 1099-18]|uniref:Uncharacterized protein n=1 Tax=Sporothrix schenckii 1099-18 TaxID=1397361 RepID=A0A0F2M407_SPOSC|nr:uncharacterized protein SPSK_04594 [Sporothrix schenckii 1099-18]KJR83505.1 hypothetical protein SPSK_04594 [Sporothrix schenckii 1099-18]